MAASDQREIACDVGALAPVDGTTVDALARLQLAATRCGYRIRVCNASYELRELLRFAGLDDVLRVEPGGEAEEREQRLGLEEERELADPPV